MIEPQTLLLFLLFTFLPTSLIQINNNVFSNLEMIYQIGWIGVHCHCALILLFSSIISTS